MFKTEKELITGLKEGDENAYRYLFDYHYAILCQAATGFVKDDFLAETIVGDVIFHLWEKRATIEIRTSLRAYLIKAVRNRCINYLRREYIVREIRISNEKGDSNILKPQFISDQYPLATLLEKEMEQEIEKSIENLPDQCRSVFKMSRFDNMKHQEIAKKLNISVNTVKYHIKNALAKLSNDLRNYFIIIIILIFRR